MTTTARLEISGRHAVQYCLQPAIEIQVRKKGLGSLSVVMPSKNFSVPILVSTVSGVRTDSGILVLKPGVASWATAIPVIAEQFTNTASTKGLM